MNQKILGEGIRSIPDPGGRHNRATFVEPHQYADGVEYVLVNGERVVDGGRLTGALPGEAISREGSHDPRAQVRK